MGSVGREGGRRGWVMTRRSGTVRNRMVKRRRRRMGSVGREGGRRG